MTLRSGAYFNEILLIPIESIRSTAELNSGPLFPINFFQLKLLADIRNSADAEMVRTHYDSLSAIPNEKQMPSLSAFSMFLYRWPQSIIFSTFFLRSLKLRDSTLFECKTFATSSMGGFPIHSRKSTRTMQDKRCAIRD